MSTHPPTPAELAGELCAVVAGIHRRGWCLGTSGNFSVVVCREPLRLLITPSGYDKGRLQPEDLLTVGGDGRPVESDDRRPSAETLLHLAAAEVAGAGATLHTHSVAGTLLGRHLLPRGELILAGFEMLKGLEGITTHDAEVRIPIFENTQDMPALAAEVRRRLTARPSLHGFLIAGHGLYTWGRDLAQAQRHLEVLEFLIECEARSAGWAALPRAREASV